MASKFYGRMKLDPKSRPIVERIAARLDALIVNQSDVARRTGLKQSAISAWSSMRQRVYFDQAVRLAQALGVSLDVLAGVVERPEPQTDRDRALLLIDMLGADEAVRRLLRDDRQPRQPPSVLADPPVHSGPIPAVIVGPPQIAPGPIQADADGDHEAPPEKHRRPKRRK